MTALTAIDETAALEQLHDLGCTDGLPVVLPTPDRVARMALAMGYDPDLELGIMGPMLGSCTVEKLAASAVMAGCLPDHAPIVVAAARAVMDPRFDLTEMQATTHSTAPLIIVNGPARHWCGGIHGGFGALGPGYRANASIGRALRLAMINIGGGRSGSADMALIGHPGKFTMCLAEDEENSPFPPMHTAFGFDAEQSTVTVIGAESPQSAIAVVDADDDTNPRRMLHSFAKGFANVTTNNVALRFGQAPLALNPDHAAVLAGAGYSRRDIQEAIVEMAVISAEEVVESGAGMSIPEPGSTIRCFKEPDDVLVFVAGGGGLYSAVFPTWCAGPHRNRAVTVEVEVGQACDVPALVGLSSNAL